MGRQSFGFAANDATLASIGTTYLSVLMHADSSIDAKSAELPSAGWLDSIELNFLKTAGSDPTELYFYLTWDSAGDHAITTPVKLQSSNEDFVAGGTSNEFTTAVKIARYFRSPAVQTTAGKVYLWVKTDSGATLTLQWAGLYWADGRRL